MKYLTGGGRRWSSVQELSVSFSRHCSCRFCSQITRPDSLSIRHITRLSEFVHSLPNIERVILYGDVFAYSPLLHAFLDRLRESNVYRIKPVRVVLLVTKLDGADLVSLFRYQDFIERIRIDLGTHLSSDWPSFEAYRELINAGFHVDYLIEASDFTVSDLSQHIAYLCDEIDESSTVNVWFALRDRWRYFPLLRFFWCMIRRPNVELLTCPMEPMNTTGALSVCPAGWGSYDSNVFDGSIHPCICDHATVGGFKRKQHITTDLSVFDVERYHWFLQRFTSNIPMTTCRVQNRALYRDLYKIPFWRVLLAIMLFLVRRRRS